MKKIYKNARNTDIPVVLKFPEQRFALEGCEVFQLMSDAAGNTTFFFVAYDGKYTLWQAQEGFPNVPDLYWITTKTTTKGVVGDDFDSIRDYVRDYEYNKGLLYAPSFKSVDPTWNNATEMLWENDWRARSPSNPHDKDYPFELPLLELDRVLRLGSGVEPCDIFTTQFRMKRDAEKSHLWDYSAEKFKWGIEGCSLATVDSVGFYIPWNTVIDYRYTKLIWNEGYRNLAVVYENARESIGFNAFMEVLGYIPFAQSIVNNRLVHVRYIIPLVPAFARKDTLTGYTTFDEGYECRDYMRARKDVSVLYAWELSAKYGYLLQKQYEVWFEGVENVPENLKYSDIVSQEPVVSPQGPDYVEVSTDRESQQKTFEMPGFSGINYPMNIETFRQIETMYKKGMIPQWQFQQIAKIFHENGII